MLAAWYKKQMEVKAREEGREEGRASERKAWQDWRGELEAWERRRIEAEKKEVRSANHARASGSKTRQPTVRGSPCWQPGIRNRWKSKSVKRVARRDAPRNGGLAELAQRTGGLGAPEDRGGASRQYV